MAKHSTIPTPASTDDATPTGDPVVDKLREVYGGDASTYDDHQGSDFPVEQDTHEPEPEPMEPAPEPSAAEPELEPAEPAQSLSALQQQALQRAGLTEQVEGLTYEAQVSLADKLHDAQNEISRRMAEIGRARNQGQPPTEEEVEDADAEEITDGEDDALKAIGLPSSEEFLEEFDQELHDRLYKPLANMAKRLHGGEQQAPSDPAPMEPSVPSPAPPDRANVMREVDAFFKETSPDLLEIYGQGTDATISTEQRDARFAVALKADEIWNGAQSIGKPMSVTDSLRDAQAIVLGELLQHQAETRGRNKRQVNNRQLHPPAGNAGAGASGGDPDRPEVFDAMDEVVERLGIDWPD